MTFNNVFNAEKKDYGHSKSLFLGQRSGLFDSIHNQHPRIHNLYKQLRSLEWDEQEFGFENLNAEFKAQPKDLARIMNWTVGWQWEGDSTAANTIWSIMCNFVSNSQLQAAWTKITENENLHTLTYSEIVRQSFDDPEQALSEILERKESFMRLEKVATVMSHCYEVSHKVALGIIDRDSDEAYDAAIMFTFALFVLERLQFMASFAVTFAIGQQDAFIPIAKAVQRICQDEYEIHVELDKAVMENEFNLDKGRAALQRQLPTMLEFLHETLVAELTWSDTIIPEDCTTLRYLRNADLRKWVKFNAKAIYDEIAQYIDFEMPEIMLDAPEENPLIWIEDWINVAGIQASPQEQQNAQYRTNVIQRDDHDKTFDFKLFQEDEKIAA